MSKTIITVVVALIIVAAVSYGFYAYTRPAMAPTVINTNTTVTNTKTTNSNSAKDETTTKIYLVALEDNGKSGEKIGCGDSLVAVDAPNISTNEPTPVNKVKVAVEALLAIKDERYGQSGLYNALYNSNLTVSSVTISSGDNVEANIGLTGTITSGGACDDPRIQNQLVETVKAQNSAITTVDITLDGVALDKVLSGAGQ